MIPSSMKLIIVLFVTLQICKATPERLIRGDFTYQASLRTYWTHHYCAGAILSDRWVVTSAACTVYSFFDINDAFVVVGGFDVYEGDSYDCDLIKQHDLFKFPHYDYDIALARTSTSILFNQFVQPIPYFRGVIAADGLNNAVAIGWGRVWNDGSMQQQLTYTNVTVLPKVECTALWQENFQPPSLPYTSLCGTYPLEADGLQCDIEFGVPLATSNSRVLLGVFAGYECDGVIRPDLYTGTADVAYWIYQNTYVDGVIGL